MRIIAGVARGRRIEAPAGWATRPTLDRVRENLFNILAPRVHNAAFLDLFAGTGANGLEALSRGATRAVLVDNDPAALAVIRRNVSLCGFTETAQCLRLVLPAGLDRITGPFDLVFADPPYAFPQAEALLLGLDTHHLLAPGGCIIYESARKSPPPDILGCWTLFRRAEYGDTALSFYS
jgi:16S rRNA (guanine(966)-N(2))-methyltransferase RsmD